MIIHVYVNKNISLTFHEDIIQWNIAGFVYWLTPDESIEFIRSTTGGRDE